MSDNSNGEAMWFSAVTLWPNAIQAEDVPHGEGPTFSTPMTPSSVDKATFERVSGSDEQYANTVKLEDRESGALETLYRNEDLDWQIFVPFRCLSQEQYSQNQDPVIKSLQFTSPHRWESRMDSDQWMRSILHAGSPNMETCQEQVDAVFATEYDLMRYDIKAETERRLSTFFHTVLAERYGGPAPRRWGQGGRT